MSGNRIGIIGAGAMGSLIAAKLTLAGIEATLYGRPSEHLARIQRDGLTVVGLDGRQLTVPLTATSDPAALHDVGLAIVLVKTWATADALAPIRPHLAPETGLLTLQNGLGNPEAIRAALAPATPPILIGITTQAALRLDPGLIQHTGAGPTAIGLEDGTSSPLLTETVQTFDNADLPAFAVTDIQRWIWRKLAINAAINPITALAGVPNGAIAHDPGLRAAAMLLANETANVGRGLGVALGDIETAVLDVARQTARNHSSMRQDLEQGIRTEIDAINGAVVAEGSRLDINVPANQLIAALIRARERGDDHQTDEETSLQWRRVPATGDGEAREEEPPA